MMFAGIRPRLTKEDLALAHAMAVKWRSNRIREAGSEEEADRRARADGRSPRSQTFEYREQLSAAQIFYSRLAGRTRLADDVPRAYLAAHAADFPPKDGIPPRLEDPEV